MIETNARVQEIGKYTSIEKYSYSENKFLSLDIPERETYLGWLQNGTLAFVYAPRGVGKTWFSLIIAECVTRRIDLGLWKSENPAGVLYVDGEMSPSDLQQRLQMLSSNLPKKEAPFVILSSAVMHQEANRCPNINDAEWRYEIYETLRNHPKVRVLILDNLASLAPGNEENDKDSWDPINEWLKRLRFLGVSVILVHHAGKGGDQRGTSSHEDCMDVVIKMSLPRSYKPSDGFMAKIEFTKNRSYRGDGINPFILSIPAEGKDSPGAIWQTSVGIVESRDRIIALFGQNKTNKQISDITGKDKSWVSKVKKSAIQQGLLNTDGTLTEAGKQQYGNYGMDDCIED